jgi:hypothetical protein
MGRPQRIDRPQPWLSLLGLFLMLAGQAVSLMHTLRVVHRICPEHLDLIEVEGGTLARHQDAAAPPDQGASLRQAGSDTTHQDHCGPAELIQPTTVLRPGSLAAEVVPVDTSAPRPYRANHLERPVPLLSLAPSHSPPTA